MFPIVTDVVCTAIYAPFAALTAVMGAVNASLIIREEKLAIKMQQEPQQAKKTKCDNEMKQIVRNLNNIIGISSNGIPYSEYGILHLLETSINIDINYVYDNGKTLLDIAIDLSSLTAFNNILNNFTLSLETLYHSINYLNETMARLPKNKTRKQMKLILDEKITLI